jgi:hypothetical protein
MQTVKRPWWAHWEAETVQVDKVPAPAFFDTAYAVYNRGVRLGYVASQRTPGRDTLWAYAVDLSDLRLASSPTRTLAIEALIGKRD